MALALAVSNPHAVLAVILGLATRLAFSNLCDGSEHLAHQNSGRVASMKKSRTGPARSSRPDVAISNPASPRYGLHRGMALALGDLRIAACEEAPASLPPSLRPSRVCSLVHPVEEIWNSVRSEFGRFRFHSLQSKIPNRTQYPTHGNRAAFVPRRILP